MYAEPFTVFLGYNPAYAVAAVDVEEQVILLSKIKSQ
jgi:hypothetical protein